MDRRRFLIAGAGAAGFSLLAGCDRLGGETSRFLAGVGLREPAPLVLRPGMAEGHALRDAARWPAPQDEIVTEVAILGGGVAGLSAAWQLARGGLHDFLLVDGPEFGGNAAAGNFGGIGTDDLRFPRGAHYLPLPSAESTHIREMLADTGVILRDPFAARPDFDERALVHAPDERLFFDGKWRDGLLPSDAVPDAEATQHARFLVRVGQLKSARGSDGRKVFAIPLALASQDPAWTALDRQSMRQWMLAEGYTSPTLHGYVDYCCRDDYGAGHDLISAWAGLHYFASRAGHADNAADGAVLTWPDGLHTMVTRLCARIDAYRAAQTGARPWRRPGIALQVREQGREVSVLCAWWPQGAPISAPRTCRIRARRVICAMPLHVAAHVAPLGEFGFDPARHLPPTAPWMVSSFRLRGFPPEAPGVPLAWDNVVHGGRGLGYVVSTHQLIRQAKPAATVFTAYCPLDAAAAAGGPPRSVADTRRWLAEAAPAELMDYATTDLHTAYGRAFWRHADAVEITVRGHAMASPRTGFLANAGATALRAADGRILFAHADLSGLSVFEEAAWWGTRAARTILD